MPIPEKRYARLEALIGLWELSKDDVFYAIENGLLQCCVWLQPRYVERGLDEGGLFLAQQCERCQGLVMLRSEDCQVIFQQGEVHAHSFLSMNQPSEMLRITHEPPQPYINIGLQHLLVMREEQQRFEAAYKVACKKRFKRRKFKGGKKPRNTEANIRVHNDYKEVLVGNSTYHFGQVQADIVKQLHDASKSSDPWVHGKTLLNHSGSQAMRFQDVFKNKKGWRDIIESDGRGHYRLKLKAKQFYKPPADDTVERKQAAN